VPKSEYEPYKYYLKESEITELDNDYIGLLKSKDLEIRAGVIRYAFPISISTAEEFENLKTNLYIQGNDFFPVELRDKEIEGVKDVYALME
jgi:hypothetical protein